MHQTDTQQLRIKKSSWRARGDVSDLRPGVVMQKTMHDLAVSRDAVPWALIYVASLLP